MLSKWEIFSTMGVNQIRKRKEAIKKLEELYAKGQHVFVIHYSCESFYDRPNGRTPRVTSIAIRNLDSGQTKSFSIHKITEQQEIDFEQIPDKYDVLEKSMLDEFFAFIGGHKGYFWVHWHMRDMNYGFPALEHRYKVLGGNPVIIEDSQKFDLARALVSIYGHNHAPHRRLENLLKMNKIHNDAFLTGAEEAKAFENREYVQLHQSTLAKTDMIANIFGRAVDRTLITNATWRDMYGSYLAGFAEKARKHWVVTLLGLTSSLFYIAHFLLGYLIKLIRRT